MCGSGQPSTTYKVNTVERKIYLKDLLVLQKWTKGALARRHLRKNKICNDIANLKYPTYEDNQLTTTNDSLLTQK